MCGTAWDVFETWADIVEGFAERGGVLDLERYTKVDLKPEDIKDFYPWQWNAFRLYNIRWGMPKYVNVMTLWINKDTFERERGQAAHQGLDAHRLRRRHGAPDQVRELRDVAIWGGGHRTKKLGHFCYRHVGQERGRPQGQHRVPAAREAGPGRPGLDAQPPVGPAGDGAAQQAEAVVGLNPSPSTSTTRSSPSWRTASTPTPWPATWRTSSSSCGCTSPRGR